MKNNDKFNNEMMERDLEIGREIQSSFLPENIPQIPGWEIAFRFKAARQVSGDFYDVFLLSECRYTGIVVADVCDKGIGAALFMALFRSLIRAFTELHYPKAAVCSFDIVKSDLSNTGLFGSSLNANKIHNIIMQTNNYIATTHGRANMFATIFFGIIENNSGILTYVNGGHEAPAIIRPNGIRKRLELTGPAVGMMPDVQFDIKETVIKPGETLLIFTDGITEAAGLTALFFGEEKLLDLLTIPFPSAEALLERIEASLSEHTGGADQSDDITLLALKRASDIEREAKK